MDTTTMIGLVCWAAGLLAGWFARGLAERAWRQETTTAPAPMWMGVDGLYVLDPELGPVRVNQNTAAANPGPEPSLYEPIRVAGREAWRQQTRQAIQAYRKAHDARSENS